MMTANQIWLQQLENSIAQGETQAALDALIRTATKAEKQDEKQQLLLLSSQYHEYLRQQRVGLDTEASTSVRIHQALLTLAAELAGNDAATLTAPQSNLSEPPFQPRLPNNTPTAAAVPSYALIAIGVVLAILALAFVMGWFSPKTADKKDIAAVSNDVNTPTTIPTTTPQSPAPKPQTTEAPQTTPPPTNAAPAATNMPTTPAPKSQADEAEKQFQRAKRAFDEHQYPQTIELLSSIANVLFENSDAVLHLRGKAKARLNRLNDAIADYDKTIALNPFFAAAFFDKSRALYDLKQPEKLAEALETVNKGLALQPNDGWGLECKQMIIKAKH
jgi:tetratricopeptide (TPR) repeat protein